MKIRGSKRKKIALLRSGAALREAPKDSLTVIVPTKDRPAQLAATLNYFNAARLPYKILVLLSGTRAGYVSDIYPHLDIEMLEFAGDITLFHKLTMGLNKVDTPLVAMCADDDIALPNGLHQSALFLLQHSEYSACQGYHGVFSQEGSVTNLYKIANFTPSLESDEPLSRLNELIRRYQQICWATFRTPVLKEAISHFSLYSNISFNELLWSDITAIRGKVKRLPIISCLRRLGNLHFMGHPLYGMMEEPQIFFHEYDSYRNILVKLLKPSTTLNPRELTRVIDLIHSCYFAREIATGPLNYFTNKVLLDPNVSIHNPDIDKALRIKPDFTKGRKKEVRVGKQRYRLFSQFLRPHPRGEILLPKNFEQQLIADIHPYFEKSGTEKIAV